MSTEAKAYKVTRSEAEWRELLTPEQYAVMRTQSPMSLITPTTLLIAAAAYLLFLPTLA